MTKPILVASLLLIGACGGRSTAPTSSPAPERAVRLLEAEDVALPPVLYAAAKHLFDPNASQVIGFGGVYVNKKFQPSLSADVQSYIIRNGGFKQTSRPVDCEGTAPDRPAAPRAPAPPTATGGAPNPPSQPKRTTGAALCNRGADIGYRFNAVRIASDTAYVEVEVGGVAKTTTKCLSLTVDKDAGGWKPGEMKTSKIGKCGA